MFTYYIIMFNDLERQRDFLLLEQSALRLKILISASDNLVTNVFDHDSR